jgi:beta-phosphoglucomutase-like phosphatase (HAD superfamily)
MGLRLAIASSSPTDWVTSNLARWDLNRYFEAIVCAGRDLPAKPNPTLYLNALEQLGAQPENAVAFEDSPNGIAASTAAGIFTIACPNPITSLLDLSKADRVVLSLEAVSLRKLAQELAGAKGSSGSSPRAKP